jgi:hypothetical protein
MGRRWLLSLVCLGCALLFLSQVSTAHFELRVNEAATRLFLKDLAPEVSLVVENGSNDSMRALVRLELLAPNNKVSATSERKVDLKSGTQKLPFTLPLKTHDLTPDEESQVLWYRLHYRITPENTEPNTDAVDGFISLSEITPELFDLQVVGPRSIIPGKAYTPRVRAVHPLTRCPFKDVQVKGLITATDDDNHDISLTSSALTDAEGFANLNFKLPLNLDEDDIEVNIEGTLGLITVQAKKDLNLSNRPKMFVSTDKPLYQPGQTVYARLLMFGPSKHAVADKEVQLTITDPEGTAVFSATLKTSRFGIASAEWPVPDTTRLGDYQIKFSADDEDHESSAVVKISRYDLPTFAVSVKTDRPYYLEAQNATVEIKADYLFGKPVNKGHVRLVRETERSWNYREQKYETEEGDKYEGDTQPDGVFKAQIDLSDDYAKLGDEDYRRFNDLPYAAYFTDPTTNRTEQRRFNIRLTKDAIHIYVVRPRDSYSENRSQPLEFFVTTFYADGTPAPSNLTIRLAASRNQAARVLRQVRTNRYGLAKIAQLRLPPADLADATLDLELEARDKDGQAGKHAESFSLTDKPVINVTTTKCLLAAGEPIEASITSSRQNLPLTVMVSRDDEVIHSEQLKLRNGVRQSSFRTNLNTKR